MALLGFSYHLMPQRKKILGIRTHNSQLWSCTRLGPLKDAPPTELQRRGIPTTTCCSCAGSSPSTFFAHLLASGTSGVPLQRLGLGLDQLERNNGMKRLERLSSWQWPQFNWMGRLLSEAFSVQLLVLLLNSDFYLSTLTGDLLFISIGFRTICIILQLPVEIVGTLYWLYAVCF